MNENLAKALGINFIKKGHCGARHLNKCDVSVTKCKDCYRFSFSESSAKKIGDYVKIAPTNNRIYFVPAPQKDEYAYKMTAFIKQKCSRRAVQISFGRMPNIDNMIGDYELKYFSDRDAYYITKELKGERV